MSYEKVGRALLEGRLTSGDFYSLLEFNKNHNKANGRFSAGSSGSSGGDSSGGSASSVEEYNGASVPEKYRKDIDTWDGRRRSVALGTMDKRQTECRLNTV